MDPLEFSVIDPPESLAALLERSGFACQLHESTTWSEAWMELSQAALYRFGPDVSQVGTTWLNSFVAAGAVRPFTAEEVTSMGGSSPFLPISWEAVSTLPRRPRVWAIPWLSDVRVILYWRDMLERAGVDEETAFQTPEQIEETMERLQASGIDTPWGIWASGWLTVLQNAASWVWGKGGGFISADERQILFDRQEACDGLLAHIRLHRYLPPMVGSIENIDARDLFAARRVAVVMGNGGWLPWVYEHSTIPDAADRLGVAMPPGPAFVGGSNLIVWQHSHRVQEAVGLIRFLISKQVQSEYCRSTILLPVRLDVLAEPPYTTDPHYRVIAEALKTGRAFPMVPKWAIAETKLARSLVWLWDSMVADPDQDLEDLVRPYIENVARRLVVSLGTRQ